MLAAALRAIVVLAVCYVLFVQAGSLVALISDDPVVAARVLVVGYATVAVLRLLVRLLFPLRAVLTPSIASLSAAAAVVGEGETAAAAGGFDRVRRARHEAAHAVIALRVGKQNVTADIVMHRGRGGQVAYETSARSLVDATYDDMLVGFAGHIVDTEAGHFDGGSRNDMRALTEGALLILSTGLRPARFVGQLTLESLVCAAREDAARMLEESADTVALVAVALEREGRLSQPQLLEVAEKGMAAQ